MKEIGIYDISGKKVDTLKVTAPAIDESTASAAYAVAVRRLLQQWRQGTVGCKTRGEVALSNRKPFKQKGTGRARAGTFRSPLWRKGGAIFGPQKRVHEVKISRKQNQFALRASFSSALKTGQFFGIDFDSAHASTKAAYEALKGIGVEGKKVVLFLSFEDKKSYLSFRNIPNVFVVFYDQPNVFDMTNGDSWVFIAKDKALFNDMVEKWK